MFFFVNIHALHPPRGLPVARCSRRRNDTNARCETRKGGDGGCAQDPRTQAPERPSRDEHRRLQNGMPSSSTVGVESASLSQDAHRWSEVVSNEPLDDVSIASPEPAVMKFGIYTGSNLAHASPATRRAFRRPRATRSSAPPRAIERRQRPISPVTSRDSAPRNRSLRQAPAREKARPCGFRRRAARSGHGGPFRDTGLCS